MNKHLLKIEELQANIIAEKTLLLISLEMAIFEVLQVNSLGDIRAKQVYSYFAYNRFGFSSVSIYQRLGYLSEAAVRKSSERWEDKIKEVDVLNGNECKEITERVRELMS